MRFGHRLQPHVALPRRALAAASLVAALGSTSRAGATPTFPGQVDSFLGMPGQVEKIFPSMGCHLCHVNDVGGAPYTPFGTLAIIDGARPYSAQLLLDALAKIEIDQPQLIADLKAGKDPNGDMSLANQPLAHVPSYGCGSMAPRAPEGKGTALSVLTIACASLARRRRTRAT
jgi:hypothetical protein